MRRQWEWLNRPGRPFALRILFSTTGGTGHLTPLLPFAAACRDAGHDVRIATQRARVPVVERAGFTAAPFDDPPAAAWAATRERVARLPLEEANATMLRDVFDGVNARSALPGLTATVEVNGRAEGDEGEVEVARASQ